jgi:excisionase family DNA binding protein
MVIDLNELEGKVFTPEEAAERSGVNPDTMRRLCRTGKIRASKPAGSKSYFILGVDLIRYIEGKPPRGPEE